MSQCSIIDIEGSHPQIPTQFDTDSGFAIPIGNVLEILGDNGVTTTGSGNTVTVLGVNATYTDNGVASFDPTMFTVTDGFVQLIGGSTGIDSIAVDSFTAPGTNPVLPNGGGLISVTGSQVAAGTTTNVIRTDSLSANSYTIEIQRSSAQLVTTIGANGVSHFNSSHFTVDANGFVSLTGGGQAIDSFTTDVSGPVSPDGSGNVAFTGATNIFSDGSVANTMRLNLQGTNHALYVGRGTNLASANLAVGTNGQVLIAATGADPAFSTVGTNANMNTVLGANSLTLNPYNCAKWIVDPTANIGTHQTITAALAAASSGDTIFVRPATYTEDPPLKAGVHITAFDGDELISNVTIVGNCTFSSAGTATISGIRLRTNSNNFLTVSGSAASIVRLDHCYLDCLNNSGISFTTSNVSSTINITNCSGNLATTGIALFTQSSTGSLLFIRTLISNTGSSTTANTISAGTLGLFYSNLTIPVTSSGTAGIGIFYSGLDSAATNTKALTVGGSGTNLSYYSEYSSGSATTITVTSTLSLENCNIDSSNTAAIDGAGTLSYNGLTFGQTSSNITTTTQTILKEGPSKTIGSTNSGAANVLTVTNTSNTATSSAQIAVSVAGATAADPTILMTTTTTNWIIGVDNSVTSPTADPFVISQGTALGTNNIMSVATSGEINYPLQPSFYAHQASSGTNNTGDGTVYTLGTTVDLTEIFDQNGDFDPTTGVLTAPVDGKYQLNGRASVTGGTAITSYTGTIVTSNRNHALRCDFAAAAAVPNFDICNSDLCDMDAADTATYTVATSDTGGKIDDVFGAATGGFTSFSGFLQA